MSVIMAAQNGDNSAFALLYDHYVRPIYRFVFLKTSHKETAEDITSKVFIKALEKIKTYKAGKAPFSGWLYAIARNTVIDHYRTHKREDNVDDKYDLAGNEDILGATDLKMKMENVMSLLNDLDSVQRDVIVMRVCQEMSYQEIAAAIGKSEANCRVIYARGLNVLKDKIPVALYLLLIFHSIK